LTAGLVWKSWVPRWLRWAIRKGCLKPQIALYTKSISGSGIQNPGPGVGTARTPSPGPNYKPVVAAVFAAVLLLAGYWLLVHRRRESGSREKRKVFLIHAAPWAALEATTGVVSAATGLLAIPPLLGPGTVVDGAILLAGLAWIWHRSRSDSGRYR